MEQKESFSAIQKRAKALWADSRPYKIRLLMAFAVMLAAGFTFVFFGPLEMVAFSGDSLYYSYKEILLPLILGSLAVLALGTLLLSLLQGKIFNYALSLVFAFTLAGYLQAALMNGGLGTLTGDAIDWPSMAPKMLGNLAFWGLIPAAVLLLMYLSRKFWKNTLLIVSALLVVMQAVPTVGILCGLYDGTKSEKIDDYMLSEEGIHSYSSKDNIFVIVLDRLDYDYVTRMQRKDPHFFDKMDGFTCYTNAISVYARTRPALNGLLTGTGENAYRIPYGEFLDQNWHTNSPNLLQQLDEKGFRIDCYANIKDLFSDPETVIPYVDNAAPRHASPLPGQVMKKLAVFSAYRYGPLAIKPFYWRDTNYYNNVYGANPAGAYQVNDTRYAPGFRTANLSSEQPCFKFYHFFGPHAPYTMKADGTLSDVETSLEEQMTGSFHNLYAMFDQMKKLGIYDDATIIITADHGDAVSDRKPLQKATRIGLFYKPSGKGSGAMEYSKAPVSTVNIPATVIKAAGGDYSGFPPAFDEVPEDAVTERIYYKTVIHPKTNREVELYIYKVTGDASDFDNWEIIDHITSIHGYA